MTESIYKEYQNKYYNPNDNDKKPGDNDNWKSIQEGFHRIGSTQLETSAGLTLGKGTEDETSVTAGELEEIKNPSQLETSGGLTLGKGTEDETSLTAAELSEMKQGGSELVKVGMYSYMGFTNSGITTTEQEIDMSITITGLKPNSTYAVIVQPMGIYPYKPTTSNNNKAIITPLLENDVLGTIYTTTNEEGTANVHRFYTIKAKGTTIPASDQPEVRVQYVAIPNASL